MNIDVVALRKFREEKSAIDVAFPVIAIECEVIPPIDNELDAYEEAALKLVSTGLAANGIGRILSISDSLAENILFQLEGKEYISKQKGKGWKLTEEGNKYLNGIIEVRPSKNSKYGYMFISALRKDVLQYFYEGDIANIVRTDGWIAKNKLTLSNNEDETFVLKQAKGYKLNQAYLKYNKNCELFNKQQEEEITPQEAKDIYADLDSFDEVFDYDESEEPTTLQDETPFQGSFVRQLKTLPKKLYFQMRIVFDPVMPGGFKIESPLDFNGMDNEFFERQFQWLQSVDNIYLGTDRLSSFMNQELNKLVSFGNGTIKDKSLIILQKMPLLSAEKDKYSSIYGDVSDIFRLVGNNMTKLEMESVVSAFNRNLLEKLFNNMFNKFSVGLLMKIKSNAYSEIKTYTADGFLNRVLETSDITESTVLDGKVIQSAISRLGYTNGNSILEKLINTLVIYYHMPSNDTIRNYISQPDFVDNIELISKLNKIRCKTSHDSKEPFTETDYKYYIDNVYTVANKLLEAQKEN